jgi:predicted homoserine dehydrogenase-like protein
MQAIPIGLAENSIMLKDVKKGLPITEWNCKPDSSTIIYRLRKEQDKIFHV